MLDRVRAWMGEQGMLEGTETVLCALSGGADSVCLLHLLHRFAGEGGFRLEAAHFHHGIRGPEADRDRDFCVSLCRDLGIPLHLGQGDVPAFARERGMGLEEAARELRYAFLEKTADTLPACRVATAHQAEDNAETLLMHLARGTGLRGLGGIPPVRGRIIRPLLPVTREEVLAYLEEHRLPHVEDSTNALDAGERNILRRRVLPVLRELNPSFPRGMQETAELLREDEACLDALARELMELASRPRSGPVSEVRYSCARLISAPRPLSSRALRLGAEELGVSLERRHIAALLDMAAGSGGLSGLDLPGGLRASREFDLLRLRPPGEDAAPYDIPLAYGTWTVIPATGRRVYWGPPGEAEKVHEKFQIFRFKNAGICGSIHVRSRKSGDFLRVSGRGLEKRLKKWMIEEKIPALERVLWPVFVDDLGVLAVPGLGTAERAAASEHEADGVLLLSERKTYAIGEIPGNAHQRGTDRG